jgi:SAM-dependent methyltransferase
MTTAPTYFPNIFDVADERSAKAIILTDEGQGADTEARWTLETPYVLELLRAGLALGPDSLVLDYGCGIGRMAKAMIDATGCSVIGVDISPSMRRLAVDYVGSDRFLSVSPGQFDTLVRRGLRMQAAISIWVLQHCLAPAEDVSRLRGCLAENGRCFVLNMPKRAVPAVHSQPAGKSQFLWAQDSIDVQALLRTAFKVEGVGVPDTRRAPNMGDVGAYWMLLRI